MADKLILVELSGGRALLGVFVDWDSNECMVIENPRILIPQQNPNKPGEMGMALVPWYGAQETRIAHGSVSMHTSQIPPDLEKAYLQSTSKLDLTTRISPGVSVGATAELESRPAR